MTHSIALNFLEPAGASSRQQAHRRTRRSKRVPPWFIGMYAMMTAHPPPSPRVLPKRSMAFVSTAPASSLKFPPSGVLGPGASIGRHQVTLAKWSLELGGHCHTGFEDDVRLDKDTLAPSNASLVRQVVEQCAAYGRKPATAAQARSLLGLPSQASAA